MSPADPVADPAAAGLTRRTFVGTAAALAAAGATGAVSGPGAAWTPPADPDPKAILREAREDAGAGRYAVALAKQVWFHEHALEFQPSQGGVRLSFALSDWKRLADRYPPALDAMKAARDRAAAAVLAVPAPEVPESRATFHAFHDFESLNRSLGDPGRTVAFFELLDRERPAAAAAAARLVRPALIRAKNFALAGKYVDPEGVSLEIEHYPLQLDIASLPRFSDDLRRQVEAAFQEQVATSIALLVKTDRPAEAKTLAEEAKAVRRDAPFVKAIDAALNGVLPPLRGTA